MMKLSAERIMEWASGRPSNPITRDGVYMAIEIRELREKVKTLEAQLVNVNASLSHALRERERLEEDRP